MDIDLKEHLKRLGSEDARKAFADRVGTSLGHLRNIANGYKSCATDLAVSIELDSGRSVRRWSLRPHDWHRHWPELIGAAGAPAVAASAEPEPKAA